jgi:hypothetical protein
MIPRMEQNKDEGTVIFRDRYAPLAVLQTYVEEAGFRAPLAVSAGGMTPASSPANMVLTKEAYDWLLRTSPEKVSPYLPANHAKKVKPSMSGFTLGGPAN